MSVTRLAPSPTGALHLGNARTFLVNWLLARQNGWRVILRIEDIDGPRIKPHADRQAIEDLRWLGLDWDEGPIYQTARMPLYAEALQRLMASGHAYCCTCTRKEVELAASAPHAEDGAAIYPGRCRGRFADAADARARTGRTPAIRFMVPDLDMTIHDNFHGAYGCNPERDLGDFVIAKADGTPSYQLAVVVDDADAGVQHVVRGDDLLDSTPRQLLLYKALGWEDRIPQYWHLPLVVGKDGRRLAKRHGDTRIAHYRDAGVTCGRLLALLARWCGVESGDAISLDELLRCFDITRLPRERIVFTHEDDAWLSA